MHTDSFNFRTVKEHLLILQFLPVNPSGHVQLKPLNRSMQVPPFSHGPLEQSSISVEGYENNFSTSYVTKLS